jgi:hypothetical protein
VLVFGLTPLVRSTWRDDSLAAAGLDMPRPILSADEPDWAELAQNSRDKLPVGEAAPDVALRDLETGRPVRLGDLRGGEWAVVLLSSFT